MVKWLVDVVSYVEAVAAAAAAAVFEVLLVQIHRISFDAGPSCFRPSSRR